VRLVVAVCRQTLHSNAVPRTVASCRPLAVGLPTGLHNWLHKGCPVRSRFRRLARGQARDPARSREAGHSRMIWRPPHTVRFFVTGRMDR